MKLKMVIVENFRCFANETFSFSDETIVRAFNGAGKSTIAEAVVWCLYGTNIMGSKRYDSVLMREGTNNMKVITVWETASGQDVTVERVKPETGGVKQFINGNKVKPGQLESLFFNSVQEFLSVFIPGYFSSIEPKDAKAIIARYSDVEPNIVLSSLLPKHRGVLENEKFGMGYDSIQILAKKASTELRELTEDLLRLDGEISTYEAILAEPKPEQPKSLVTEEIKAQVNRYSERIAEFDFTQKNVMNQRKELNTQIYRKQETYKSIRAQRKTLDDTCPTCKQKLLGDALKTAKQEVEFHNATVERELKKIELEGIELRKKLEELQSLESHKTISEIEKMRNFVNKVNTQLGNERDAFTRYEEWQKRYDRASNELNRLKGIREIQQENIEKLSLKIEATKAFRSQYVRMQQNKIDKLLDNVKIQLFRVNEDGEVLDGFRILWNNKPYNLLSHSEKVWCDLEIGRAIFQLRPNPEPFPVFVDDAESVLNLFNTQHDRQIIAAYAYRSSLIVEERKLTALHLEEEIRNLQSLISSRSA
ncbi:AAA family ATPase [Alicyclobacillus suci]|uniref:AAA family ATPase n=1 Tax=Alicyclobacillus suci TaxID=2816080 RepID=UPI001A8E290E|nr:AAA family ATPase [Alicyclobacillus suci]